MKFSAALLAAFIIVSVFSRCVSNPQPEARKSDSVAANIGMYTHTWDEIINHRKLELFNDSNFTRNVIMHANPDVVGIERDFFDNLDLMTQLGQMPKAAGK